MTGYQREQFWVHSDPDPQPETARAFCVVCSACSCTVPQQTCQGGHWRTRMVGYLVCSRCKTRTSDQLSGLLEGYALTEGELTPGSGSGRGSERPIGVRVSALSMLAGHDLLGVLGSWERDWRETFGFAPPPTRQRGERTQKVTASLAEIVGFLQTHLDTACRTHPAIDEFARELRLLSREMSVAARLSHPSRLTFPCPTDFDDGPCATRLTIEQSDLDEEIVCPLCQTRWTASRLMAVATSDPDYAMTADALSVWLKVTENQLCRWANAGRIRTTGRLFNLVDTRAAIWADQQAPYRRLHRAITSERMSG